MRAVSTASGGVVFLEENIVRRQNSSVSYKDIVAPEKSRPQHKSSQKWYKTSSESRTEQAGLRRAS